jgi:hypothetical protein
LWYCILGLETAAAAWIITSPEPIKNLPLIGGTRKAAESVFTVVYKTARGTGRSVAFFLCRCDVCLILGFGRAAWYSATTLFFMVYPVLYVLAPEDAGSDAAGAAASAGAKAATAS